MNKKRRTRPSKTYTFRVHLDEDNDLVSWLESMSPGQRSEAVRDALRAHRNEELSAIRRDTQQILELLKRGVSLAQGAPESRIDEQSAERRKGNLLEAGW